MVEIKPFDLQNVTVHYKWNNDEELNYYDSEYPHEIESFDSFLNRIKTVLDEENTASELFEIHLAQNDKLIGIVDIHAIDAYNRRCYVNCTIGDREYSGSAYEMGALKQSLDYCFEQLKMHKVLTTAFDFNTQWIGEVRQLGFRKEAELRKHVLKKGIYRNKLIFGLLSDEYEKTAKNSELSAVK
ncbi:MAG: GNAT family protein [Balneolaceae bacterium]|nr:GNAT family protein [Balneolaceae bacterium]